MPGLTHRRASKPGTVGRMPDAFAATPMCRYHASGFRSVDSSRACHAEMRSTLKWRKRSLLVHEADTTKGGKPWSPHQGEAASPTPLKWKRRGRWSP